MSNYSFKVNLNPERAYDMVKEGQNAELVYEEFIDIGDGRKIGTLVFEKYFFRVSNRAALIVIIDDINGYTDIRVIATGSSQGMIFNFDWGASDSFAYSVKKSLVNYIID